MCREVAWTELTIEVTLMSYIQSKTHGFKYKNYSSYHVITGFLLENYLRRMMAFSENYEAIHFKKLN